MSDPTIERIEAELRESQFKPWDVETFLAGRHQAKIEALTAPENNLTGRVARVAREMATAALALIGFVALVSVLGLWILTGQYPLPH